VLSAIVSALILHLTAQNQSLRKKSSSHSTSFAGELRAFSPRAAERVPGLPTDRQAMKQI
jgi:hypothetical protein